MSVPMNLLNRYFSSYIDEDDRPAFIDIDDVEPALHLITAQFEPIRAELVDLLRESSSRLPTYHSLDPRQQRISASTEHRWTVFPFECFGLVSHQAFERCPNTWAAIRAVPSRLQAFFSVLEPGKCIPEHRGPYLGYLRYHLGLIVPDTEPPSIVVNRQRYTWGEGESVLFDDNLPHRVENTSNGIRAVLIVDVRRPMPFVPDMVNRIATGVGGRLTVGRRMMRAAGSLS
jgi:aspartate beta-hydroxylase